jgi:hypothetical protein
MEQARNLNTTNWSKNSASSHDVLGGNGSLSSVRSRKRFWRSPSRLFKRLWQATLRRLSIAADPEKSSFFAISAAALRSLLLVRLAGWGAAFQNDPGPLENGPMRSGEDSMIKTSCVSSSAQSSRDSGISVILAVTLPRRSPRTKAPSHPFHPALHL